MLSCTCQLTRLWLRANQPGLSGYSLYMYKYPVFICNLYLYITYKIITARLCAPRYLRAAEALLAGGTATRDGLARSIFLSTEDPSAIAFFQGLAGWEVSFTHVPRKPDAKVAPNPRGFQTPDISYRSINKYIVSNV